MKVGYVYLMRGPNEGYRTRRQTLSVSQRSQESHSFTHQNLTTLLTSSLQHTQLPSGVQADHSFALPTSAKDHGQTSRGWTGHASGLHPHPESRSVCHGHCMIPVPLFFRIPPASPSHEIGLLHVVSPAEEATEGDVDAPSRQKQVLHIRLSGSFAAMVQRALSAIASVSACGVAGRLLSVTL